VDRARQWRPPSLLTTAACGGLRSTPDCRTRRALLHLSYGYAPPLTAGVIKTIEPLASKNGNQVVVNCDVAITLHADQMRLQALLNLMSNADKFPKKRTLTIAAHQGLGSCPRIRRNAPRPGRQSGPRAQGGPKPRARSCQYAQGVQRICAPAAGSQADTAQSRFGSCIPFTASRQDGPFTLMSPASPRLNGCPFSIARRHEIRR
jgi:hypothetical protein